MRLQVTLTGSNGKNEVTWGILNGVFATQADLVELIIHLPICRQGCNPLIQLSETPAPRDVPQPARLTLRNVHKAAFA